ncbi:IQ motif and SEC7 domain-containing protein 3-like [Heteronotia binoei]|uniref:IQ motif and SEC7 domain-containing protein 3-like n=1 Tax=Heteronotia binoei TaxID=13085 RepID=UPI00292FFF18|nr:IQ motif and SEC7 domain-containing protein 3-like [Heteronotia binoei]
METPAENPSKAAEYLKELNKIIETQQELLEKQKLRIDELEQQVAKLYHENARLQDEHQRHLATCSLLLLQQQGTLPAPPPPPRDGQDNAKEEQSEVDSSRSIRTQVDERGSTASEQGRADLLPLPPTQDPSG